MAVGQVLSVPVLIWEGIAPVQLLGVDLAWPFALAAMAAALAFVIWRFQWLRSAFKEQPLALSVVPMSRGLLTLSLFFGLVWVLACVCIFADRTPLGHGFDLLLMALQAGVLLTLLFHVDGPLKNTAWTLLWVQMFCVSGVALASGQLGHVFPQVIASLVFLLAGHAVASFRVQEHERARKVLKERQEERDHLVQQLGHLQEAHAAKARLLAMVSHDLRQPVHALGLMLGRLRREASLSSLRVGM